MLVRLFVCLALAVSIPFAIVPLQARNLPAPEADCCAPLQEDGIKNDCPKHAPASSQERPCCAGCLAGLALFVTDPATSALPPPTGEQSYASFSEDGSARTQRPPVPPPRA